MKNVAWTRYEQKGEWNTKKLTERDLMKGVVVRWDQLPQREFKLMLVGCINETLSSKQGLRLAAVGNYGPKATVDSIDPGRHQTFDIVVFARWRSTSGNDSWSLCGPTTEFQWHWFLTSEIEPFIEAVCKLVHPLGYCAFGRCSV